MFWGKALSVFASSTTASHNSPFQTCNSFTLEKSQTRNGTKTAPAQSSVNTKDFMRHNIKVLSTEVNQKCKTIFHLFIFLKGEGSGGGGGGEEVQ